MHFPHLIHFFGPDGAGKSTQAEILINSLNKRGFRARNCWVRSPHTLAFVLWRLFVKIGFYRVVLNPFGAEVKLPAVDRNRLLRCFWAVVELVGVLPIILRTHVKMWRGYTLVAERYILDTVTTIAYFVNDVNFLRSAASRVLLHFIPGNTAFIFLNSDYETIYYRRAPLVDAENSKVKRRNTYGAIPKSAVEPRDFIEFQRTAYKALAKSFDALVIDTSKISVEKTARLILQYFGFND